MHKLRKEEIFIKEKQRLVGKAKLTLTKENVTAYLILKVVIVENVKYYFK